MKFLKKRRNAFFIAIVAVVLSTLFGAYRSLGGAAREVSDTFYDGVSDNYTSSIYNQLQNRGAATMNMITIGVGYAEYDNVLEGDTERLRAARNDLLDAMADGKGPAVLYGLDAELQDAADTLYASLSAYLPASSDSAALGELSNLEIDYGTLNNAARVIEECGYNKHVRSFRSSVLSVFPANLLKTVTFVDEPELFE